MPYHNDDGADLDHSEYPEPDADTNGHIEMARCPQCRASVYEEAERCPRCGHYITDEEQDAPRHGRPWWFIIGLIACLAVALGWAFSR